MNSKEKKYKAYNKYTGNAIDYFTKNDYLYITSKEIIPAITIGGIWDDILEFNCNSCGEDITNCDNIKDKEFKVDAYLEEPIIELAFNELVNLFSRNQEDIENDSKDK